MTYQPMVQPATRRLNWEMWQEMNRKEYGKTEETTHIDRKNVIELYENQWRSHVTVCCRLLAPVGCSECSGVAFCSINCKDEAMGSYHRYECRYMDLLVGSGMSILCHLALRIITQSGLQHFLDIKDTLHESFSQPNTHPGDLHFLMEKEN